MILSDYSRPIAISRFDILSGCFAALAADRGDSPATTMGPKADIDFGGAGDTPLGNEVPPVSQGSSLCS